MKIKGWIQETSWLDKEIYIVDEGENENYNTLLYRKLLPFENKTVKCRYVTKKEKFDDIDTEIFNQVFGLLERDTVDFDISDVTINDYEHLKIGGHDLYQELVNKSGRYIVLEIEEVDTKKLFSEE